MDVSENGVKIPQMAWPSGFETIGLNFGGVPVTFQVQKALQEPYSLKKTHKHT